MRYGRIALALAVLALAALPVSGLGVRAGLWPFRIGFALFAGALFAGLAAAGTAALGLALKKRSRAMLIAALVLGLAAAAVPLEHVRRVKTLPYINDVTTDTQTPPQFSEEKKYQAHFAELQALGYPQLRPLELAAPPAQAFARARAAAQALGWEIAASDESAGRLEAVATTRWFGFKDDIAVRVAPAAAGSRSDVRSRSRVGRSDLGANARRIQDFLAAVAESR